MTRPVALEHDVHAVRGAKSRATSSRCACTSSMDRPVSRAISPGCGVMTIADAVAALEPRRLRRRTRSARRHRARAARPIARRARARALRPTATGQARARPRCTSASNASRLIERVGRRAVPSAASASGERHVLGARARRRLATTTRGVATVTRPAPERRAPPWRPDSPRRSSRATRRRRARGRSRPCASRARAAR